MNYIGEELEQRMYETDIEIEELSEEASVSIDDIESLLENTKYSEQINDSSLRRMEKVLILEENYFSDPAIREQHEIDMIEEEKRYYLKHMIIAALSLLVSIYCKFF